MYLELTINQTELDKEKGIVATDIGYPLYKNPFGKLLKFDLNYGILNIFFKESKPEKCTMNLLYDVDSLNLFKKAARGDIQQDSIENYVHNKAYIHSAIFSQALTKVFGTCMSGKGKDRPELVEHKWSIELKLTTVQTNRLSEEIMTKLFTELGYEVTATRHNYDNEYEDWGLSNNYTLELKHSGITMKDLFTQLYVLIPVINPDRHFFIDETTMNNMITKGNTWLSNHSMKDIIVRRYLGQHKELSNSALEALKTEEEIQAEKEEAKNKQPSEGDLEKKESLGEKRYNKILSIIENAKYCTFVDFGCNDGKLIRKALEVKKEDDLEHPEYFKAIIGVDVAYRTLEFNARKLSQKFEKEDLKRVNLVVSSLMYQDYRLKNRDVFVLSEVIEHIDAEKHDIVLDNIFTYYSPNMVIMTTPNKDYNIVYDIPDDKMRHRDHRFEWTREEFKKWAWNVKNKYSNYDLDRFDFIGDIHDEYEGSCQYVVFTKRDMAGWSTDDNRLISDKLFNRAIMKDNGIRLDRLLNDRWIPTRFNQSIEIKKENTHEPLHNLSRFSVPFEQLIYIPPTMSPVESGSNRNFLEYPTDAFRYFQTKGIDSVICETKHMGSRMNLLVCRNEYTAKTLFNFIDNEFGIAWTRSGRRFFRDKETEQEVINTFREAITKADMWSELKTDWILFDCEMMPWNFLGEYGLIVKKFADIGCSGEIMLKNSLDAINDFTTNRTDIAELFLDEDVSKLSKNYTDRLEAVKEYNQSYRNYIWKVNSTTDLKIAPFHILATAKTVHSDKTHVWHLDNIKKIVYSDESGILENTDYLIVNLNNEDEIKAACDKWEWETGNGAEGMVIKPMTFLTKDEDDEYVQPAIKCRGRNYLRLIYGAEYTLYLDLLRRRHVKKKRYLAMNEFLLGLEGLTRFTQNSSLEEIHECVFGVMTLDAEPVDARL